METKALIDISLALEFGKNPKQDLKNFINQAIDKGDYSEGFEVALKKDDLDYQEYEELLKAFYQAYNANIPELHNVKELIETHLPAACSSLVWLISENCEIVISDGLHVAMIKNNGLKWKTPRISYDGIKLLGVKDSIISGEWYSPVDVNSPWSPFQLSLERGELIEGKIIE